MVSSRKTTRTSISDRHRDRIADVNAPDHLSCCHRRLFPTAQGASSSIRSLGGIAPLPIAPATYARSSARGACEPHAAPGSSRTAPRQRAVPGPDPPTSPWRDLDPATAKGIVPLDERPRHVYAKKAEVAAGGTRLRRARRAPRSPRNDTTSDCADVTRHAPRAAGRHRHRRCVADAPQGPIRTRLAPARASSWAPPRDRPRAGRRLRAPDSSPRSACAASLPR
jgi:hypothetical protein